MPTADPLLIDAATLAGSVLYLAPLVVLVAVFLLGFSILGDLLR